AGRPEDGRQLQCALAPEQRRVGRTRIAEGRETTRGRKSDGRQGSHEAMSARPNQPFRRAGSACARMYSARWATLARAWRDSSLLEILMPNSFSNVTTSSNASMESRLRPEPINGSSSARSEGFTSSSFRVVTMSCLRRGMRESDMRRVTDELDELFGPASHGRT